MATMSKQEVFAEMTRLGIDRVVIGFYFDDQDYGHFNINQPVAYTSDNAEGAEGVEMDRALDLRVTDETGVYDTVAHTRWKDDETIEAFRGKWETTYRPATDAEITYYRLMKALDAPLGESGNSPVSEGDYGDLIWDATNGTLKLVYTEQVVTYQNHTITL